MNVRRVCGFPPVVLVVSFAFLCATAPVAFAAASTFGAYFEALDSYSLENTWYPVVADLDLDGRDDVIHIRGDFFEHRLPTLVIRFGESNGRLAPIPLALPLPITMSIDSWPCISDIDGDDIPDIVIGCQDSLLIVRGLGGRTFAPGVAMPEQAENYVSAGDLNGDGFADYACTDPPFQAPDSVRIRFGIGGLSFVPGPAFRVRRGSDGAHFRDFNGDQLLDVFVGADTTSTLLLNLGGGAFAQFDVSAAHPKPAGDLDNDGLEDLMTLTSVYLNNGDGTFQPAIPHGLTAAQCAVDLNEDGRLDLVGKKSMPPFVHMAVVIGNGDGTFDPEVTYPTRYDGEPTISHGDFDQDGHQDLVALRWDYASEAYMFGRGTGGFRQGARSFPAGQTGLVSVGNFGPDTHPDILVYGGSQISVLLAQGAADYAAPQTYPSLPAIRTLAVGDLNGDSRDDVVACYGNTQMQSVWLTQPDGTLGARLDSPSVGGVSFCGLADLDDDGALDLVTNLILDFYVDTLACWRHGNGDGTFGPPNWLPTTLGGRFTTVDLDGDEDLDIVALGSFHPYGDGVRVLLANGPGVFPGYAEYVVGGTDRLFTGYFNGDDILDVFVFSNGDWCLPGLGGGLLGVPIQIGPAPFSGPNSASLCGDVNSDGFSDLIGYGRAAAIAVRLGTGGQMTPSVGYGPMRFSSNAWGGMALADVDGNGAPDIIAREDQGNLVTVLLNQTITPTVGVPPSHSPRPAARLAVRATPNPAPGRVALRLELAGSGPVEVAMFDLSGRRVSGATIARPAARSVTIPLEGTERLAPGVYLVRVRQGSDTATSRACLMR